MLEYLKQLADKTDPTASMKHFVFMVGIAFSCGWLTAGLFLKNGLDDNWVNAFALFLIAITGAKVWSERKPTPAEPGHKVNHESTKESPEKKEQA